MNDVSLSAPCERTQIGRSGLRVSRIGFGCCPMGGHGWGEVDEGLVIAAVHRALDLGVQLFDTADVYGFGRSEELLSRALGARRHEVVIASKFGVRWSASGKISRDSSPAYLEEALHDSLRRLRVERIPLYQIHWPDPSTPLEATLAALERYRGQGKIGAIGLSNFGPAEVDAAARLCRVESLQTQYSLACRDVERWLEEKARTQDLAVLTWGSLAQGLFSGKYGAATRFPESDRRHRYDNFLGERFQRNLKVVESLRELARIYGRTPAQVALRWLLDAPGVSVALTGIKRPEQIEENAGAMGWWLAPEHRERLSAIASASAQAAEGVN
jgi:aryl-alcohol dehydrogenase-like predicted oxidoreductase